MENKVESNDYTYILNMNILPEFDDTTGEFFWNNNQKNSSQKSDNNEDMKKENGFKFIVVAITDIIRNGSYFIFTESAKEVLEAGYGEKDMKQGTYLEDQVSRKKQIVPTLISGLNRLK